MPRKTPPQSAAKPPFPLPDVVTKVVPAPTEGWDAISPLSSMDPKRAPILTNWVPRPGWVELRAGYTPWSFTGSGSTAVETLFVYNSTTAASKMFAAAGSAIYDVSTMGTATAVQTGLSSARWQYINFTPANAPTVIQLVNGVDQLRQYNGTTWSTPVITGLPGGLTTANIFNIFAQKRRLWYVLGNGSGGRSSIVAFMQTDAIAGAIGGTIDFGAIWTLGGYLVDMADWTVDGGAGPQDYAAFISSQGELALYSGTDPTSATNWSLVGVFRLQPPIGDECFTQVGSDVAVITADGIIPLSQALPFNPSSDRSVAITARIQNAMANYTTQAKQNYGWQVILYPAQQLLFVNVPLVTNQQQVQLVMNMITGAWCLFTGWNANSFVVFQDELYFGDNNGYVNLAYNGGMDNITPIVSDMQVAYNWFDDPGRAKRITLVQPLLIASGTLSPAISVDEDFVISSSTAPITILSGGVLWDSAVWDVSKWSGETGVLKPWLSAEAIGHALAVHLTVNVSTSESTSTIAVFDSALFDQAQFDTPISTLSPVLQVNAFNVVMELGGFI